MNEHAQARNAWRRGEAVPKEMVELINCYGRSLLSALRLHLPPAMPSCKWRRHDNLIVVGMDRPLGETLFFGRVAANILEIQSASHPVDR